MEWLEGLGLFGLFIGTFLAATIFPFSSDALYLAILAATANPVGCLFVGTLVIHHIARTVAIAVFKILNQHRSIAHVLNALLLSRQRTVFFV